MKKIITILIMALVSSLALAQPSLPIDFESAEVEYTFNDFEGGVITVIDNPDASGLNTSAKVGQMVKFAGATFAGSTIPLAEAIDFGDNNAFKMKVWANRVGAPILFKLEGPAEVQVTQTTTVANAWEELTFSFAGLTGGTYTAITLIYDNGVVGDGGADFTFYFDDIELTSVIGGLTLPIDFESTDIEYTFNDFEGGVITVIDNPDASGLNTSAKVGEMVKFAGATFAGSTIPLAEAIDFGDNNAFRMKVWANRVGAPILFKLEGPAEVQVTQTTTVANAWEELTFSFAGLTGGIYTGVTLIYDNGVAGDGGADFTFYFDDIELTSVIGGLTLPIDFESTDIEYTFNDFEGGVITVIDNPDVSGGNTSAKVGQMVKGPGATFAGSTIPLAEAIDFGGNNAFKMKVWANRVGAPILFKLEGPAEVQATQTTTVANAWEELTFSFAGLTGGTYTAITLIYDNGVAGDGGADFTFYFDDIELTTFEGEVVALPIDFESTELTYSFSDFEGGVAKVIDNPDASGINTSAKVGEMIKFAGAPFAGSTLALGSPVVIEDNTSISMKVWANRVGAPVLLKLEGNPAEEVSVSTTVANQWETLDFDFSGKTPGTYNAITIIYDLGVIGDGSANFTLYFDDIAYTGTSSVVDVKELGVSIFPNPVRDILYINSQEPVVAATVYDLSGRMVHSERVAGGLTEVDLSGLSSGIYFVSMRIGDQIGSTKIIKQ